MNSRASRRAPVRSARANVRHRQRRTITKRRLKVGLVVVGILLLGSVTWLATRVLVVKTDLEAAQGLVSQLQTEVGAGDFSSLDSTTTKLQAKSASAAAGTRDVTWRAAEYLPLVGENLVAVRVVSESIDDIVREVAVPAVGLLANFDMNARDPETGGFDLSPIVGAQDIADDAQRVFSESLSKLNKVNASGTVGPVSAAVEKLDGLLITANDVAIKAGPLLKIAGTALGQEGPRNYLLAFQNNAESTALGGSAASLLLMNANAGAISIAEQKGSGDFVEGTAVDVSVDQSALDLYSDYLINHINTSTSRPDFPTAAEIMSAFWLRDQGTAVDGVISVDPIALSYILRATGPLTLPSGDVLTSDNAVSLLVNEIYFRYPQAEDQEQADAFFESAAAAILAKVTSGEFDVKSMLSAVTDGVNQGSIMLWSAVPEEQALLDGELLQGRLPSANDERTVIGTYFRDVSASKMDYYLETNSTTTTDVCTAPTNPSFTTSVTLHSRITEDEAAGLPDYIRSANFGLYLFSTEVYVYGPVGASVTSQQVDLAGSGTEVTGSSTDLGRPVARFRVNLAPGETSTVSVSFTGAPGSYGAVELRGTPMINATGRTLEPANCG